MSFGMWQVWVSWKNNSRWAYSKNAAHQRHNRVGIPREGDNIPRAPESYDPEEPSALIILIDNWEVITICTEFNNLPFLEMIRAYRQMSRCAHLGERFLNLGVKWRHFRNVQFCILKGKIKWIKDYQWDLEKDYERYNWIEQELHTYFWLRNEERRKLIQE